VFFRTIATTLILVVAGVQISGRRPLESISAADFGWFGVVALDYLLTLVSALLLRRGSAGRWLAWVQVVGAVAFATSIVLLTDRRDSPFWFTYLLAIIGGLMLVETLRGPLKRVTEAMSRLASGDLDISIDGRNRGDERTGGDGHRDTPREHPAQLGK